jgi:2-oxo-4-hydroxy-4-carboxy--5-ureidoimidazoline (OHCU) decarboxylase
MGKRRPKSQAVVDRNEQNDEIENLSAANDRLFDLQADPGEKRNVIKDHPEVALRLKAALDAAKAKGLAQPLPQ